MTRQRTEVARPPLDEISAAVCERVRPLVAEGALRLDFINFHGFQKSRFQEEFLQKVLEPFALTPALIQIEVAGVLTDLTHEVHTHERTEAYVTCIGEDFGLPNPRLGFAFMKDRWLPVKRGDSFQIPVNMAHGFTVDPGGVMYFLSVQTPPLVSLDGHEDYLVHPLTR